MFKADIIVLLKSIMFT